MKRTTYSTDVGVVVMTIALVNGCSDEIVEPVRTNEVAGAPEIPRNLATSVGERNSDPVMGN